MVWFPYHSDNLLIHLIERDDVFNPDIVNGLALLENVCSTLDWTFIAL